MTSTTNSAQTDKPAMIHAIPADRPPAAIATPQAAEPTAGGEAKPGSAAGLAAAGTPGDSQVEPADDMPPESWDAWADREAAKLAAEADPDTEAADDEASRRNRIGSANRQRAKSQAAREIAPDVPPNITYEDLVASGREIPLGIIREPRTLRQMREENLD